MSALSAMQDKTQHLENSLSAETRIKLDLFSALGDAKRQLEIAQGRPVVFDTYIRLLPFTSLGSLTHFCIELRYDYNQFYEIMILNPLQ